MPRKTLPSRRNHITQRVKIGGKRTLYLSVDSETEPSEIFIRIRGETGVEKVTCYDVIARLISLALQEGVALEVIAERLHGTRMEPYGSVEGDAHIKFASGSLDYIGKHLLIQYCGRHDLSHAKTATGDQVPEKE